MVNTARWDPDAVLGIARSAVESYEAAADEGAFPVEGVRYDFG